MTATHLPRPSDPLKHAQQVRQSELAVILPKEGSLLAYRSTVYAIIPSRSSDLRITFSALVMALDRAVEKGEFRSHSCLIQAVPGGGPSR